MVTRNIFAFSVVYAKIVVVVSYFLVMEDMDLVVASSHHSENVIATNIARLQVGTWIAASVLSTDSMICEHVDEFLASGPKLDQRMQVVLS